VAAAFAPVLENGFVAYDDDQYVSRNRRVLEGFTPAGVRWALTTDHTANWHPLTWFSLMADAQISGGAPRGFHRTSILLHLAAALLLFAALRGMVGRSGLAFWTALLWAVHPLRVESVAWIAERKDVLAGLCWILAMLLHLRFARRPTPARLLPVAAAMALGLSAKQVLVTLPLALLLLDLWPLGRHRLPDSAGRPSPWTFLLAEKVPLLILGLGAGTVTLLVQDVQPWSRSGLLHRLVAFGSALLRYLGTTFFPRGLSPFVEIPVETMPVVFQVATLVLLVASVLLPVVFFHRFPWMAVGWGWFLLVLLPMSGLGARVGAQTAADRYTYLPHLGLALLVAITMMLCMRKSLYLIVSTVVISTIFIVFTRAQSGHWRDSRTLFVHMLDLDPRNMVAANGLGLLLLEEGNPREAEELFRRALHRSGSPPGFRDFPQAFNNLGIALATLGRMGEAEEAFHNALRAKPLYPEAMGNLANVLGASGRGGEAELLYRRALGLDPGQAMVWNNLGVILLGRGERGEAAGAFRRALELDPSIPQAAENLRLLGSLPATLPGLSPSPRPAP
jgi:Flp pilus assembly protein TadD